MGALFTDLGTGRVRPALWQHLREGSSGVQVAMMLVVLRLAWGCVSSRLVNGVA